MTTTKDKDKHQRMNLRKLTSEHHDHSSLKKNRGDHRHVAHAKPVDKSFQANISMVNNHNNTEKKLSETLESQQNTSQKI